MGIQGLLQLLKPLCHVAHIGDFAGKVAAIDAMSWLYKGVYSCAQTLATGGKTYGYIKYTLKMCNLLKVYNIKPILVFDGAVAPLKLRTEGERAQEKQKLIDKAKMLQEKGNTVEANAVYAKILTITTDIIGSLIDVLRYQNIEVIIAPYEADAQIAYMYKKHYCDFAISEDSDLIAYKIKSVVYKLDTDGRCTHMRMDKLKDADFMKLVNDKYILRLKKLDSTQFTTLCAMSGCDYVENIENFGIKKCLKMFDFVDTYKEIINKLQLKKKFSSKVPPNYKERVLNAINQFKHAWVFDKPTEEMVNLKPIKKEDEFNTEKIIGPKFAKDILIKHCTGLYDIRKAEDRKCLSSDEIVAILSDLRAGAPSIIKDAITLKNSPNSNQKDTTNKTNQQSDAKPKSHMIIENETKESSFAQMNKGFKESMEEIKKEIKNSIIDEFNSILTPTKKIITSECVEEIHPVVDYTKLNKFSVNKVPPKIQSPHEEAKEKSTPSIQKM